MSTVPSPSLLPHCPPPSLRRAPLHRPLQLRALSLALAAAELDPAEAVVVQTSRMQDVLRDEGLVRYVVSFL